MCECMLECIQLLIVCWANKPKCQHHKVVLPCSCISYFCVSFFSFSFAFGTNRVKMAEMSVYAVSDKKDSPSFTCGYV